MKILLATQHPYLPQIAGGAQSSMHELTLALTERGHTVAALTGLTGERSIGIRGRVALKFGRRLTVADRTLGYTVYRAWDPTAAAAEAVARFAPDVAVVQSGRTVPLARALSETGTRTLAYLRNVEVDDLDGDPSTLEGCAFIANSEFTARWYAQTFGIAADVVYPLFSAERYRTETTREAVVFINPHPLKGLDVALGLARACPDIPFLFVEAWTLDRDARAELLRQLKELPNVTLLPRTSDMREIYRRARIVLAPSQWREAFGRIAAEAHYSAIPVLASRIGGLPEAVGDGGTLVDHNAPLDDWIVALRSMWDVEATYARKSQAAALYGGRDALDRERQLDRLEAIFAGKTSPAPASVAAMEATL